MFLTSECLEEGISPARLKLDKFTWFGQWKGSVIDVCGDVKDWMSIAKLFFPALVKVEVESEACLSPLAWISDKDIVESSTKLKDGLLNGIRYLQMT